MIGLYARLWREVGKSGARRASLAYPIKEPLPRTLSSIEGVSMSPKAALQDATNLPKPKRISIGIISSPLELGAQRTDSVLKMKKHPMRNSTLGAVGVGSVLGVVWSTYRIVVDLNTLIQGVAGPMGLITGIPFGNISKTIAAIVFLRYIWSPAILIGVETEDAPPLRAATVHRFHSIKVSAHIDSGGAKSSASSVATARPRAGLNQFESEPEPKTERPAIVNVLHVNVQI